MPASGMWGGCARYKGEIGEEVIFQQRLKRFVEQARGAARICRGALTENELLQRRTKENE
jgi:hypothetical protein